jgi:hypothetical protein
VDLAYGAPLLRVGVVDLRTEKRVPVSFLFPFDVSEHRRVVEELIELGQLGEPGIEGLHHVGDAWLKHCFHAPDVLEGGVVDAE